MQRVAGTTTSRGVTLDEGPSRKGSARGRRYSRALFAGALLLAVPLAFSSVNLPVWLYLLVSLAELWLCARYLAQRYLLIGAFGFALSSVFALGSWIAFLGRSSLSFKGMLRAEVFYNDAVMAALKVLLIATIAYFALCEELRPSGQLYWNPPDPVERAAARAAVYVLLPLGVALTALTAGGSSIIAHRYVGAADAPPVIDSGGLAFAGPVFFALTVIAAARAFGSNSATYRVTLTVVLLLVGTFKFMRGERAGTLVIVVAIFCVHLLSRRKHRLIDKLKLIGALAAVGLTFQVWADVRVHAAEYGLWPATESAFSNLAAMSNSTGDWTIDPLRIQLVPAGFWHTLQCVDMRATGLGPGASGFYSLPLLALPSPLLDLARIERPRMGALLFQQYRISNGGLFILAEGFWYGGMIGAVVVAAALALILCGMERYLRKGVPLSSAALLAFAGSAGFGVFYGIQPLIKAIELTALLILCTRYLVNRKSKRRRATTGAQTPGFPAGSALWATPPAVRGQS